MSTVFLSYSYVLWCPNFISIQIFYDLKIQNLYEKWEKFQHLSKDKDENRYNWDNCIVLKREFMAALKWQPANYDTIEIIVLQSMLSRRRENQMFSYLIIFRKWLMYICHFTKNDRVDKRIQQFNFKIHLVPSSLIHTKKFKIFAVVLTFSTASLRFLEYLKFSSNPRDAVGNVNITDNNHLNIENNRQICNWQDLRKMAWKIGGVNDSKSYLTDILH